MSDMAENFLVSIGHFGVAQGTRASFKFQPINKWIPPHERSK